MIGKIKGLLTEMHGTVGLIETSGGVSYDVFLPPALASQTQAEVAVYTYLHVRDDALILFGFENRRSHDLFLQLLSVSGVGPKTAYTIVTSGQYDDLIDAITENKVEYFKRIPGLGSKTAMKIILELSQKFKTGFNMEKMYLSEDDKTVVAALVSLGFSTHEAKAALEQIPKTLSLEEKIRKGIQLSTNKQGT